MFSTENQLRVPYSNYQCQEIKRAISQIPESRRKELRKEILTRANLMGVSNPQVCKTVLDLL